MPVKVENIDFLVAFIRNMEDLGQNSDFYAEQFSEKIKEIVKARVNKSEFLGGKWQSKPYSSNPIKAYKLGFATVSGQGMEKSLTINGISINDEDWYWGEWDREKKGIEPFWDGSTDERDMHPVHTNPLPVFVPGYRGWRMNYNSLSDQVNLNFNGNTIDNFNIHMDRVRGSNQYGGKYTFSLLTDGEIGNITHYYREWKGISQEELNEAMDEIGGNIMNMLFSREGVRAPRSRKFS